MKIENLYLFEINYNPRNVSNASDSKIMFSDSDNICKLAPLPDDTIFISCKKWDKKTRCFVLIKNYAFGRELNRQDLNDEMERTNSESKKSDVETILKYYLPKNKENGLKYCIFKNHDNICVYDTFDVECEFLSEKRLVNGKVLDKKEFDYLDKDYLNLE